MSVPVLPDAGTDPATDEDAIRTDERARLAELLERHADDLVMFTLNPERLLGLIVYLLRLNVPTDVLAAARVYLGEGGKQ